MADSSGDSYNRHQGNKRSRPASPDEADPRWLVPFRDSLFNLENEAHKRLRTLEDYDMDQPADLRVKKDRNDCPSNDFGTPEHQLPGGDGFGRFSRVSLEERTGENEVTVLSDEESPRINGHVNGCGGSGSDDELPIPLPEIKISPDELKDREKIVRRLRTHLRNEEMKLVLLKKLRQSQQMKENLGLTSNAGKIPILNRSGQPSNIPPPLVRGGHMSQGKQVMQPPSQHPSQQPMMPPLVRPQNFQGPPPLVMAPRVTSSSTLPANVMLQQGMIRAPNLVGRLPMNNSPNIVLGYPMQGQPQTSLLQSNNVSNNQGSNQTQCSSSLERIDNQTPAQRQAAAKLALRKQLEKTLLQIPPPKPPPPEMHFIPNPANTEFIYLVGLEVVVNFIVEDKRFDDAPKAFECVQCGTDFTPVWKWDNPTKQTVICEQCVTSNIKKALKAEHTNRLKTAFVKALQQEQEIEQSMAQVSSSPPATVTTQSPHHTGAMPQVPKLTEPLRQSAANLSMAHQQMLRLPHQPLPAHMLSFSPLLSQAYPYQVLGKAPMASQDLQRQYLLDMIPPRSMPQGTINWKT